MAGLTKQRRSLAALKVYGPLGLKSQTVLLAMSISNILNNFQGTCTLVSLQKVFWDQDP